MKNLTFKFLVIAILIAFVNIHAKSQTHACNITASFYAYSLTCGTYMFMNESSNEGNNYHIIWNINGTIIRDSNSVQYTFDSLKQGKYNVCITAIDATDSTCFDVYCDTIIINPFKGSFTFIVEKSRVKFSVSGLNNGNFYVDRWEFGNGATKYATSSTTEYVYDSIGTYNVCLYVRSETNYNCTYSVCKTVTITQLSTCMITADLSWHAAYENCGSFELYATVDNKDKPYKIDWNFGDGNSITDTTGHFLNHYYKNEGNYWLCIKVKDSVNTSCFVTVCDTLHFKKPKISFTYEVGIDYTVDFYATVDDELANKYYQITWYFNVGSNGYITYNNNYTNYSYPEAGTYIVTAVLSSYNNNCSGSFTDTITVKALSTIRGNVTTKSTEIPNRSVLMQLYRLIKSKYILYDEQVLEKSSFNFVGVKAGSYALKAVMPDSLKHLYILSTYYDSVYSWNKATNIIVGLDSTVNLLFPMVQIIPLPKGNATFSGVIKYYSYKKATGGPIPGAEIFIEQKPNDQPRMQTTTDTSGYFQFKEIPVGSYQLTVDIPGFTQWSTFNINVTTTDTSFTNLNFFVDTIYQNRIITDTSKVNVPTISQPIFNLLVYPNPFTTQITINYELKTNEYINFEIFDISGNKIFELTKRNQIAGKYEEAINIQNTNTGIYLLKTQIGNTIILKKIIKL